MLAELDVEVNPFKMFRKDLLEGLFAVFYIDSYLKKNLLFWAIKRIASAFLNGASISLLMRPESRIDLSAEKTFLLKS